MKRKIILGSMLLCLLSFGTGFAQDGISIDASLGLGSYPKNWATNISLLGTGFGFGIGASKDMPNFMEKFSIRGDISYFKWSDTEDRGDGDKDEVSLRRIPLFGGGRYIVPRGPLTLFGELGLELSFDKLTSQSTVCGESYADGRPDNPVTCSTSESDTSKTHFGITPGVGFEYPINKSMKAGLNLRYHGVEGAYFTGGAFVGYKIR